MPARDAYHDIVRRALEKDNWTITHDPFVVAVGLKHVLMDIGAERLIAAERGTEKIAVEVKMFRGGSDLHHFENALGQYVFYRSLLELTEPDRTLYLAVSQQVYESTFRLPITQPALQSLTVRLFAFDPEKEAIIRWTP